MIEVRKIPMIIILDFLVTTGGLVKQVMLVGEGVNLEGQILKHGTRAVPRGLIRREYHNNNGRGRVEALSSIEMVAAKEKQQLKAWFWFIKITKL